MLNLMIQQRSFYFYTTTNRPIINCLYYSYNHEHRDLIYGFVNFYTLDRSLYAVRTSVITPASKIKVHLFTFSYNSTGA